MCFFVYVSVSMCVFMKSLCVSLCLNVDCVCFYVSVYIGIWAFDHVLTGDNNYFTIELRLDRPKID